MHTETKDKKCRIIICTFIVFTWALLFSVNIVYPTPSFDAESIALKFLEKVAGVNTDSYIVLSFNASTVSIPNSQHFQTNMRIVISDRHNEFEALITLVDGKFWTYRIDLLPGELGEGEASLNECLTAANRAVDQYRVYFNASYCSGFAQTVSTALRTQSLTVENESTLLKINYAENNSTPLEYANIHWFNKINNQFTTPFRSVYISVSKTGLLTRLIDNMALYQVATTDIKVSKEEAINLAMPYIEAYAREYQQEIKTVNAELEYVPDIASHRGDRFAMYPRWNVLTKFDKANEYNVLGYAVLIWADNGEVYHYDPQGFYTPDEASAPSYPLWPFAVAVATIVILSGLSVYTKRQAKIRRRNVR